jgi:hypothetical protein
VPATADAPLLDELQTREALKMDAGSSALGAFDADGTGLLLRKAKAGRPAAVDAALAQVGETLAAVASDGDGVTNSDEDRLASEEGPAADGTDVAQEPTAGGAVAVEAADDGAGCEWCWT